LVIKIPNLEIFLFCQHNSTGGGNLELTQTNGCFFKFGVEAGVELSIVNALYRLRITDQLFKSHAFTRVVRSQSTLQRRL
jgi:hypothetical protein